MEETYSEIELNSEDLRLRKWMDVNTKYVWYTDLNLNFLGETVREGVYQLENNPHYAKVGGE